MKTENTRKRFLTIIILCLSITLCSCGNTQNNKNDSVASSMPSETSEIAASESSTIPKESSYISEREDTVQPSEVADDEPLSLQEIFPKPAAAINKTDTFSFKSDDGKKVTLYVPSIENISLDEKTGAQFVNNELIVTIDPEAGSEWVDRIEAVGAEIVGRNEYTHSVQIQFRQEYSYDELLEIANDIMADNAFIDAVVDYYIEMDLCSYPNDKEWINEWDGSVSGKNWGVEAINADKMWDFCSEVDTVPVKVGVYDNQFDREHEDLNFEDILFSGYDQSVKKATHGTSTSGVIAASFNNGKGIAGISTKTILYGVSILQLGSRISKIENETGLFISEEEAALTYLIGQKECKVINISMSGGGGTDIGLRIARRLEKVLHGFIDDGNEFLISKAAGNETRDFKDLDEFAYFQDQTVLDRIICVGAAKLEDDGNYYISDNSNYGEMVDVIAPGEDIYTTFAQRNRYGSISGTSFAAPHVSGVAAAMWSVNPELTGAEVKEILCNTAHGHYSYYQMQTVEHEEGSAYIITEESLGSYFEGYNYSYKLIDAYDAVKAAYEKKMGGPRVALINSEALSCLSETYGQLKNTYGGVLAEKWGTDPNVLTDTSVGWDFSFIEVHAFENTEEGMQHRWEECAESVCFTVSGTADSLLGVDSSIRMSELADVLSVEAPFSSNGESSYSEEDYYTGADPDPQGKQYILRIPCIYGLIEIRSNSAELEKDSEISITMPESWVNGIEKIIVPEVNDEASVEELITTDGDYNGQGAGMSNSPYGAYVESMTVEGNQLVIEGNPAYFSTGYTYSSDPDYVLPNGTYRFTLADSFQLTRGSNSYEADANVLSEKLADIQYAPNNTITVNNGIVTHITMVS